MTFGAPKEGKKTGGKGTHEGRTKRPVWGISFLRAKSISLALATLSEPNPDPASPQKRQID